MVFSHHQQQQQEEKYAKIIIFYGFQTLRPSSSSSRKQEWLKSSFSICFRSYGRDFWEQFWCFSVLHCHGVFSSGRCIWAAAHRRWRFSILHYNGVFPSAAAGEKNVTSSVSTGFRSDASPPFTAMVLSHPGGASEQQLQQQQEEKLAKSSFCIYRLRKLRSKVFECKCRRGGSSGKKYNIISFDGFQKLR